MVSSAPKIVISGYYGFRNSGDEAVLKSILTALKEEGEQTGLTVEPIVLSSDPAWTTKMYGVRAVHRMRLKEVRAAIRESSGVISGGGSLLQDATSPKSIPYYLAILKLAQWADKPTFVYAQGIGPVQRKWFYPLIKSVFNRCTYISVRDEQSGGLLVAMGIQRSSVHVVPDPVMGLPLPAHAESGSNGVSPAGMPVIGISVRYWDKERRELQAIADGLRKLSAKRPVHLRFLPFHLPDDVQASQYVLEQLGDVDSNGSSMSMEREITDPQQMLLEVSKCDLIIGMRLHSLIYAASREVPLLGISYDPKINHFLSRIESEPVGSSDTLNGDKLAAAAAELLDNREAWQGRRAAAIQALRQEARLPARQIIEYLSRKG
ncbi:polysaccharide pyruvyl transferase CsaB [Paenibacillus medicaginis]|uniref:Polysaccharide pyruvyl transferase CsaB n=1 Tax=Paenibacillus medicaginis TaxID=1470560 RepID=A0ABV5BZZ1_9BACL